MMMKKKDGEIVVSLSVTCVPNRTRAFSFGFYKAIFYDITRTHNTKFEWWEWNEKKTRPTELLLNGSETCEYTVHEI